MARKEHNASDEQTHKKFTKQTKGRAAVNRSQQKKRKLGLDTEPNRNRNPKAFTRPSDGSRKIAVRKRKVEQIESHARVPKVNKSLVPSSELEPPTLVAIVGPKGCGKSTFIQSFVKACVGKNLSRVYGPVTFTNGNPQRPKRYTFIECPPTLTAMIDVCKVAEVVIMIFDGSVGFEMESFEFLTLANVHGLPHIFGLLTHLDALKNNKALKKTKKKMRHRFSQEVASNSCKLFYLTGLESKTKMYKRKEMLLLGHYLATVKTEPTTWRQAHSHMLIDRFQDITPKRTVSAQKASETRQIQCYGYIRGKPLQQDTRVHIPGVGDFSLDAVEILRDPCGESDLARAGLGSGTNQTLKAKQRDRKSKAKRRAIFAPMCDLGELSYDPGGDVFVHSINSSHFVNADVAEMDATDGSHIGAKMIRDLRVMGSDDSSRLNASLNFSGPPQPKAIPEITLTKKALPSHVVAADETLIRKKKFQIAAEKDRTMAEGVDTDALTDYIENSAFEKLRIHFVTGQVFKASIGEAEDGNTPPNDDKGYESVESARSDEETDDRRDVTGAKLDTNVQSLVDFFAANNEDVEVEKETTAFNTVTAAAQSILPTGVSADYFARKQEQRRKLYEGKPARGDMAVDHGNAPEDVDPLDRKNNRACANIFQEQQTRLQTTVDEMAQHYAGSLNAILGFYPGLYARVTISNVPCGFVDAFTNVQGFSESDPSREHFPPLILGGLLPNEASNGTVHARVRKHRWKTMQVLRNRKRSEGRRSCSVRSKDPIIVSAGWRRFETQPVFAIEENGPMNRRRFMKYLPEHSHCLGAFHGPWLPPNSGICAFRLMTREAPHPDKTESQRRPRKDFRVLLTGYSMEVEANDTHRSGISKKLKLIGYPEQIAQNTVFMKDMFHSPEEAARFEGAKLKTVAGIRGAVKKALPNKNGVVRCTFEDKILKSDIICCRVYATVPIPLYCNPVTNYVLGGAKREVPEEDAEIGLWQGMRSASELLRPARVAPSKESTGQCDKDTHYAASLAAKRQGTKALLHSDIQFTMPRSLTRGAPFEERVKLSGQQPHAPRQPAIGVTTDIKKDLQELTAVHLDTKEKRQAAVERHFVHLKTRMENADAITAAVKREKLAKKLADMEERKNHVMKKLKKDHAKRGEFQKQKKQRM